MFIFPSMLYGSMEQLKQNTINRKALISYSIGLVMLGFFLGWTVAAVLNNAWGYDFENSTSYNEVMNATQNASDYVTNNATASIGAGAAIPAQTSPTVFVFDANQLTDLYNYNMQTADTSDNINLFDSLRAIYFDNEQTTNG